MELQGNRNVETESNREEKQSSSEQNQLNLIDFDSSDSSDSSHSFDSFESDDENLSLDYKDLSDEKFQQPQDLKDDTNSFTFDHMNPGDGKAPQNLKEFSNENVSHKPNDISDDNLAHNANALAIGDENVEQHSKSLIGQNLFHDAKSSIFNNDTFLQHPTYESTSQEPFKNREQELSLEEKAKHLRDKFKGIPLSIIRNILQRDDVNEDLNAAISCLKALAIGDENVEQHSKSLIGQNLFHDEKSSIFNNNTFLQPPTYENTSHEPSKNREQELSLEEKAKHLRDKFKGIPLSIIRNILQRDDVKEDLNAAISCLEAISASKGTSSIRRQEGSKVSSKRKEFERQDISSKIKPEDGLGIVNKSEEHKAREPEDSSKCEVIKTPLIQRKLASDVSSSSDGQNKHSGEQETPLNLEAKIKLLHGKFKSIPKLMIKMVLQRSDVEGDLDVASKCLNVMLVSPTKGPQGSRQETLGTNNVNKQKPPPVLPKKTKKSVKYDDDIGKRQSAHSNESTGLKLQNAKKPEGSESTVKQKQNSVSNRSSPEKMDGGEMSCPSKLRGKNNAKQVPNFEQNIILIKGLNKATSYETIINFAEAKTKEQVLEIVKLDDKTSALVKFEKIRDFNNGKEKMESCSLEGVNVTVHRVPVSSSILVRNLSFSTTRDSLEYFFTNPRIGGDVSRIQYEEGDEQAVVTFKDPDVMKKVLRSKSLKLDDAALHVELFNPFSQETTREKHSQHKIAVSIDKNVMEFISATGSLSELKESLRVQGFTMTYTSGCSFVYVTPKRANSINKERGIKIVTDFTKKFKAIELDVDKNHWDSIMIEISKLYNEIGKDKLLVKECASSKDKVTIICREPDSKELKKTFLDKIAETQSLEAKETYEEHTIDIERNKLRLLKITGYKEKLFSEYFDLKFDIDQANGKVTIAGPRQQCYGAKLKIYQELSKSCERQVSFPESFLEILDIKEVTERTTKALTLLGGMEEVYAVFHINDGNIIITGINKKHTDELSDVVKSIITEVRIEVNQEAIDIIKTQKWIDFCKKVSQEFKVYVRTNEKLDTWIIGFKENVSSAEERTKKFLDDNSFGSETLCSLNKGVRRYILEHRKDELVKMETEFSVKISADEKEDKFIISGTKVERAHAQEAVQRLVDSVSRDKKKVQQPGLLKLVTSGKVDSIIRNIEHEHKCALEKVAENGSSDATSQTDYSSASSSAGTIESEKCGNATISWKQGNIVTEHVSIQVCSTTGKLCEIFKKAGGPELSQELKELDKSSNHVIISRTGNLPCNHVILVSCCKWDGRKGEAEKQLRFILRECLQQALKLNATSIAFPIIGTGVLGFPYDKACRIMIDEVIDVTSRWEPSSLNDIRFVVFAQDAKLVNAFQQEFKLAFERSRGHESSSGGIFPQLLRLLKPASRSPGTRTNALGKVSVEVLQGDLINETTDAIVNINATDMNMQNAGALSKDVAATAGPDLQTECTKLGKQTAGSAVITGAGKLKTNHIIHMIPGEATVQHIQKCIEKCLQTAENSRFNSISIPACGTGGFKMSAVDSAQATFQALANVCPNLKHIKQIRIVIFMSQLLPAFSKKLSEFRYEAPNENESGELAKFAKQRHESRIVDEATTATIEFIVYGKSKEVVDGAMADLTRRLMEACKTRNIDDENISKLSEDQRKVLTAKANDLEVEIKFHDSIPRIEFRGNPEDIMEIYELSWKEIQNVKQDKDFIPLPKEWCPMLKQKGKEKEVHLVTLGEGSDEYKKVLKMFQQTGGTGRIIGIERIQNPHLYQQYMLKKQKMDNVNEGKDNERQLFHGTAGKNVNDINTRGFNRIFRGVHATAFGEGVYFAKEASYSHNYTAPDGSNNRHMYVARVLVGKYTKGSKEMKVPPDIPKSGGKSFDSTANSNGSDASIFVVFYDAQCYPQYLITYQ